MKELSINEAKDSLGSLIKEIAAKHEPVHISGTDGAAVLLNEDDWRAAQESLYLVSIPGMRESIREGLETPIEECSEGLN